MDYGRPVYKIRSAHFRFAKLLLFSLFTLLMAQTKTSRRKWLIWVRNRTTTPTRVIDVTQTCVIIYDINVRALSYFRARRKDRGEIIINSYDRVPR